MIWRSESECWVNRLNCKFDIKIVKRMVRQYIHWTGTWSSCIRKERWGGNKTYFWMKLGELVNLTFSFRFRQSLTLELDDENNVILLQLQDQRSFTFYSGIIHYFGRTWKFRSFFLFTWLFKPLDYAYLILLLNSLIRILWIYVRNCNELAD
jgi:hypothetical protein